MPIPMTEDQRGEVLSEAFHGLDKNFLSNIREYISSGKPIFFGRDAHENWVGWDDENKKDRVRIP